MGNGKGGSPKQQQSSQPAGEPTVNKQLVAQAQELIEELIKAQVSIENSDKDLWGYEVLNAKAALGKAMRWAKQIPTDVEQRAVAVF